MPNHDFPIGQKVFLLNDPTFRRGDIRILTGKISNKSTSPRGDEFSYNIMLDDGGLHLGVPGIFVYDSLDELQAVITKGIEDAVDDADREVNRLFKELEKAQKIQKHLRILHHEWLQEVREHAADAQPIKGDLNHQ